jgi:hypothetical protein
MTSNRGFHRSGVVLMRKLLTVVLLLCSAGVSAESRYDDTSWRLYLELDQMFVLKIGAEYSFSPQWGVKGGIGVSVLGPTVMGYEIIGVYHIMDVDNRFQCDVEFGLPVAYFDVLEGNVVDWDPLIDDPYTGWAPGFSAVWGYQFAGGSVLSLKTGVVFLFEYQRDSGWREHVVPLPEVAIQWLW